MAICRSGTTCNKYGFLTKLHFIKNVQWATHLPNISDTRTFMIHLASTILTNN